MSEPRIRILVVDNEEGVRLFFRSFLESTGFSVSQAADGLQALEVLQAQGADLMLLDLRMPRLSGIETLVRVRKSWPDLPVVVVSGAGTMEDVIQALRLGAWDYLMKPLEDLDILSHAVNRSLERARLIAENRQYQQHLEEAVEKRTAELRKANAAKDEFLAMVSHELRTPLTPVLLSLSALKNDPSLPQTAQADIAMATRNVELEARLIDDLIDLTRIMSKKLELRLRSCDIHDAIRSAASVFAPQFARKKIDLQLKLEAANPHVSADSGRLEQVFWNILGNAAKFTPDGGAVTVTTRCQTAAHGQWLVAEIRDNGIGLSHDSLSRLFTIFEQADRALTRKFGGLGIGLAISKAVMELHGGTIEAASDGPGKGAVFTVRLPTIPNS